MPREHMFPTLTKKRMMAAMAIAVSILVVSLGMLAAFGRRPANLGVKDGKLAACPGSPNCVSSQADDPRWFREPIPFTGSADDAMAKLRTIVEQQPRATIVTSESRYLHVEFRSLLVRFVDDVEFYVDESNHAIHFRSASRVGYSDLGVNRRRMEQLRAGFAGENTASG